MAENENAKDAIRAMIKDGLESLPFYGKEPTPNNVAELLELGEYADRLQAKQKELCSRCEGLYLFSLMRTHLLHEMEKEYDTATWDHLDHLRRAILLTIGLNDFAVCLCGSEVAIPEWDPPRHACGECRKVMSLLMRLGDLLVCADADVEKAEAKRDMENHLTDIGALTADGHLLSAKQFEDSCVCGSGKVKAVLTDWQNPAKNLLLTY